MEVEVEVLVECPDCGKRWVEFQKVEIEPPERDEL